jgi:hypothetical protein
MKITKTQLPGSRYTIERRQPDDRLKNYMERESHLNSWKRSNLGGETYSQYDTYVAMWESIQKRLKEEIDYHAKEKGWKEFYVMLNREIWQDMPNAFHDTWITTQSCPPRKEGTMVWHVVGEKADLIDIVNCRELMIVPVKS